MSARSRNAFESYLDAWDPGWDLGWEDVARLVEELKRERAARVALEKRVGQIEAALRDLAALGNGRAGRSASRKAA